MQTNNKALQKHEENTLKVSETSQIKKESWRVWLQAETHKSSPRLSLLSDCDLEWKPRIIREKKANSFLRSKLNQTCRLKDKDLQIFLKTATKKQK